MKVLTFDIETTKKPNHQPYQPQAKYVVGGFLLDGIYREYYHDDHSAHIVSWIVHSADLVVTFNGAFDINWLRREYGIIIDCQVWDVQLAHFVQIAQENTYPSLNEVCEWHQIPGKLDEVKALWDSGIDTPEIPRPLLSTYLEQDVHLTYTLYQRQQQLLAYQQIRLVRQQGWDLLSLAEMQWNGMKYDVAGSMIGSCAARLSMRGLEKQLESLSPSTINWGSPKQVATVLYGGPLLTLETEEYLFTYKDTKKHPVMKKRKVEKITTLPRLVEPLKDRDGEDVLSVEEGVLKKLKATGRARKILEVLGQRGKLSKLVGTYLSGIPGRIFSSGWPLVGDYGMVHGSLNQCAVVTGRLSSDKPNLQNITGDVKRFFVSRF